MVDSPDSPERAFEDVFYPADRVSFIDWREVSGAKPAVAIVGIVTILSFVTGLSNLSQLTVPTDGPVAAILPAAEIFVRFGGVLFAFLLGIVTVGLGRRKRLAWRAAVVILPVLVLLPLASLQPRDFPLLVAIIASYPLLLANRGSFDQRIELSSLQIAALFSFLGVGIYGTVGSYGLRDQFLELETWGDAFYYVIVTIATVGYGDITPLTPEAQLFSLSIILLGTGAFTVAVGTLIGPAIESRMAAAFGNMTASELTLLEDHVVVLGYGDVTESLLEEVAPDADVVVVTPDAATANDLKDEGVNVLTEDPTDESVLEDSQISDARGVVVSGPDDGRDALAIIAVRNVDPDVRIVAAANEAKHTKKLAGVGADAVINPRAIGGRLLGQSVLGDLKSITAADLVVESDAVVSTPDSSDGPSEANTQTDSADRR